MCICVPIFYPSNAQNAGAFGGLRHPGPPTRGAAVDPDRGLDSPHAPGQKGPLFPKKNPPIPKPGYGPGS